VVKGVPKSQLQPPFREKDLLPVSDFIRYCEDYGIKTDAEELEYFEKEGLLFPAVRVYRGVVELKKVFADFDGTGREEWRDVSKADLPAVKAKYKVKKIDRPTYYRWGSLWMEEGWLDEYKKLGLVVYPARQKFRPWKDYELPNIGYPTNWRVLANAAETFYTRLQMYPLTFMQRHQSITIKNSDLYASKDEWEVLREQRILPFTRVFTKQFLRRVVSDYYKLFALQQELDDLWQGRQQRVGEMLRDRQAYFKEIIGARARLGEADIDRVYESVDEVYRPMARELRRRHGVRTGVLESWRLVVLPLGLFGRSGQQGHLPKICVSSLGDELLERANDVYSIVCRLNWLIYMCGGKKATVKDLLLSWHGYRYCLYCGRAYKIDRRDRRTCGSRECEKAHSRTLKQAGRRSGRYRS
jgi:hypothetical protein